MPKKVKEESSSRDAMKSRLAALELERKLELSLERQNKMSQQQAAENKLVLSKLIKTIEEVSELSIQQTQNLVQQIQQGDQRDAYQNIHQQHQQFPLQHDHSQQLQYHQSNHHEHPHQLRAQNLHYNPYATPVQQHPQGEQMGRNQIHSQIYQDSPEHLSYVAKKPTQSLPVITAGLAVDNHVVADLSARLSDEQDECLKIAQKFHDESRHRVIFEKENAELKLRLQDIRKEVRENELRIRTLQVLDRHSDSDSCMSQHDTTCRI